MRRLIAGLFPAPERARLRAMTQRGPWIRFALPAMGRGPGALLTHWRAR